MSSNCLGRVYILAKVLSRHYDVEVIGPASDGNIWEPVREDNSLNYNIVLKTNIPNTIKVSKPDIIFASKTKITSYGVGLLYSARYHIPIILDIDDWEVGLYNSIPGKIISAVRFWDINNYCTTAIMELFARVTKHKTVSNTYLKNRFGGELIPHFRDTDVFNPRKYNISKIKKHYELSKDKKVILFLGTPRKSKGIPQLMQAVESLNRKDVLLLIVGADKNFIENSPNKPFLKLLGRQKFKDIPNFIAVADVVVVFQLNTKPTLGQLPAKIFDAMAMAKPVISTNVSDIPKVLEDCGEIVEPGNVLELSNKINYLLDNPVYAKKLGKKAREKCIKEYSYDAIAPKLHKIVQDALDTAK